MHFWNLSQQQNLKNDIWDFTNAPDFWGSKNSWIFAYHEFFFFYKKNNESTGILCKISSLLVYKPQIKSCIFEIWVSSKIWKITYEISQMPPIFGDLKIGEFLHTKVFFFIYIKNNVSTGILCKIFPLLVYKPQIKSCTENTLSRLSHRILFSRKISKRSHKCPQFLGI